MTLSADVPYVLRAAVDWLKVEDICEYLPDLNSVSAPQLWPGRLMDKYACAWWEAPGADPVYINTWDPVYYQDLDIFKQQVRPILRAAASR